MKCLIAFLMDCTALSAAPLDQGEAVEQGKKLIFSGSRNFLNSIEFAIPDSLSQRKNLGIPKGERMVVLSLSRFNWLQLNVTCKHVDSKKKCSIASFCFCE